MGAGPGQGKALTATARGIHLEFAAAADALSKLQYDPLDVNATQFDADYRAFGKTVSELERRTSAIISQVALPSKHSCSPGNRANMTGSSQKLSSA